MGYEMRNLGDIRVWEKRIRLEYVGQRVFKRNLGCDECVRMIKKGDKIVIWKAVGLEKDEVKRNSLDGRIHLCMECYKKLIDCHLAGNYGLIWNRVLRRGFENAFLRNYEEKGGLDHQWLFTESVENQGQEKHFG